MKSTATKSVLHPRNLHRERYDFERLMDVNKALKDFVGKNKYGDLSIDFFNPKAVIELNRALLKEHYQVDSWNIPENFLCPPIPGRADYIHYLADLLATENDNVIPTGEKVNCLDIGTGASCIYPLLGESIYEWCFLGTDINEKALKSAQQNSTLNNKDQKIKLALQKNKQAIFSGILKPQDRFDLCMCNPPFHSSAKEAEKSSVRKNSNLKKKKVTGVALNFGGQANELWCNNGEYGFVKQMVTESAAHKSNIMWFSVLVSKSTNLPHFTKWLVQENVAEQRVVEMKQGQKISRLLCWTFLDAEKRNIWTNKRWK